MFHIKNVLSEFFQPSALKKPWVLSKDGDISIPIAVTESLSNYHIMAVEFLYHNYRKGMKGSILNLERDMNLPLVLSAFFSALTNDAAVVLAICGRQSLCFWHYHLANHAKFEVVQLTAKRDTLAVDGKQVAFLVPSDCLKLCEDMLNYHFFSIVVEDLDQIASKRIMKKLEGEFNVGLTYRSFYLVWPCQFLVPELGTRGRDEHLHISCFQTDPDQKTQWNMLNWANPGCVGKLNDFYEIDNNNFERMVDNYRYWWLRLTWRFCESFKEPTSEELDTYKEIVSDWCSSHGLNFPRDATKKLRKRKKDEPKRTVSDEVVSDSCSSEAAIVGEVPIDKYVKLPSMDESPILTSIKKNFELWPEPVLPKARDLPYTQSKPNCSKYAENSVIWSFLENDDGPSTSKGQSETFVESESEQFIINLIGSADGQESKSQDISDILKKADAVLQN